MRAWTVELPVLSLVQPLSVRASDLDGDHDKQSPPGLGAEHPTRMTHVKWLPMCEQLPSLESKREGTNLWNQPVLDPGATHLGCATASRKGVDESG